MNTRGNTQIKPIPSWIPKTELRFDSYEMKVDELLNASDEYVLEVFHRLNAFGVKLNSQELRHGKFQGGTYKELFRAAVIDTSERWQVLWSRYKVVSVRGRLRMADDELTAQSFGVVTKWGDGRRADPHR